MGINAFVGVLKQTYDRGLLKTVIVTSSKTTKHIILDDQRMHGRIKTFPVEEEDFSFSKEEVEEYVGTVMKRGCQNDDEFGEKEFEEIVVPKLKKYSEIIHKITGGKVKVVLMISEGWKVWYKSNDPEAAILNFIYKCTYNT